MELICESLDGRMMASMYSFLSRPVRLMFLNPSLQVVGCVRDGRESCDIFQPNRSSHLTVLKIAGWIGHPSSGPLRSYDCIRPSLLKQLREEIDEPPSIRWRPKEIVVRELQQKPSHKNVASKKDLKR